MVFFTTKAVRNSYISQILCLSRIGILYGTTNISRRYREVTAKAFIIALHVLSASLLTGCNVTTGTKSTAIRVAGEQQDISSKIKVARLQEELKLANERSKLAEARADLERKKREFAEEQLRKQKENAGNSKGVAKPSQAEEDVGRGS
jgi:hypothetical protein